MSGWASGGHEARCCSLCRRHRQRPRQGRGDSTSCCTWELGLIWDVWGSELLPHQPISPSHCPHVGLTGPGRGCCPGEARHKALPVLPVLPALSALLLPAHGGGTACGQPPSWSWPGVSSLAGDAGCGTSPHCRCHLARPAGSREVAGS